MKNFLLFTFAFFIALTCAAQNKTHALPAKIYNTMHDSTTSVDVVLFHSTSSISLEGHNVHIFNSFFEPQSAPKTNLTQEGTIMWQINGREYLSGNIFLGDSTGYVVTNVKGVEYVNLINEQGNSFFKNQIKK